MEKPAKHLCHECQIYSATLMYKQKRHHNLEATLRDSQTGVVRNETEGRENVHTTYYWIRHLKPI